MKKNDRALAVRAALNHADEIATKTREACHAGQCPCCEGGEIHLTNGKAVTCPVCAGFAVIDCFVPNCAEKGCT